MHAREQLVLAVKPLREKKGCKLRANSDLKGYQSWPSEGDFRPAPNSTFIQGGYCFEGKKKVVPNLVAYFDIVIAQWTLSLGKVHVLTYALVFPSRAFVSGTIGGAVIGVWCFERRIATGLYYLFVTMF